MIKFLHAADLHLDSPFASLPPEKAALRRKEQRRLLDDLAELCAGQGCDLLLLSGDLLDAGAAFPETVEALRRALAACGARVFIAPGNHDFFAPGSPYAQSGWPENVHIFSSPVPEAVVVEPLGCAVWGAAFTARSSPALLEGFSVRDEGLYNLMTLHGEVENDRSAYNPVSRRAIEGSGLDYLALGHVHAASGPRRAGKTCYAWPGCAMGRGFDETGEKGVYLGTLGRQGVSLEFRPLPGRNYEILTVEAEDDVLAAIEAALPPDAENDIYRVILKGRCDPPDLRALHAALAPRFFGLTLRDQTTRRRELWSECGDDTLKGLFLQALRDDPARGENPQLYALAAELGVAALEGWEAP